MLTPSRYVIAMVYESTLKNKEYYMRNTISIIALMTVVGCGTELHKTAEDINTNLNRFGTEVNSNINDFGKEAGENFNDEKARLTETLIGDSRDGIDGSNGEDGTNGTDGDDGYDGSDGTDGTDGSNGYDGEDGEDGTDGEDGDSCSVYTHYYKRGSRCYKTTYLTCVGAIKEIGRRTYVANSFCS